MESEPSRADARRLLAMHRLAPHLRRRVSSRCVSDQSRGATESISKDWRSINTGSLVLELELELVLAAHSEHCKVRAESDGIESSLYSYVALSKFAIRLGSLRMVGPLVIMRDIQLLELFVSKAPALSVTVTDVIHGPKGGLWLHAVLSRY